MNLRNCAKHNRLLMQFNFPVSCKPKEILVIPNISDNIISMNSRNEKDTFTWIANRSLTQTEADGNDDDNDDNALDFRSAVTRIFQYTPQKRLLQEFDLVGVLKNQSNFA